ncbi:enoyl-CoA hydratase [Tardiphaga alba]|uniref:Enoyl-CoA hydratase n=1 Tax=Tardiphaga alba TaxID=340268 RepID=A0ABX8ADV4_9BRAD|nr:enoyl-CoA hydratase-related protein [Tardiphaga alba]QUS41933.1 enoyl-CoA hydratase [Tardiphaga alba]
MPLVLYEQRDAVAILTLNNPEQYNAMRAGLLPELNEGLTGALADDSVRAVLITGAGKGFCSGASLGGESFGSGSGVADTLRNNLNPIIEKMQTASKAIVVAVNGAAAGAGVGLALAGDIVVAARSAKFVLSFVRLGAALDAGTSLLIARSAGVARARAFALLGEPISADEAERWGLIWKAVDDVDVFAEAFSVAERLSKGPPVAIRLIKSQIQTAWSEALTTALGHEADAQGEAFATNDLREGARAFLEKRPAQFQGH